eukprot:scaffold134362_cov37-Prasinocladus_malaysianus.AAC.3
MGGFRSQLCRFAILPQKGVTDKREAAQFKTVWTGGGVYSLAVSIGVYAMSNQQRLHQLKY